MLFSAIRARARIAEKPKAGPVGSGSPKGDVLVTSAPFEDPKEGWQVLHFTVPFIASGVSLADDWHALGMRGTGSHTVVLENVFVPEEAIVLRRPRGQFHASWNVSVTVAMPLVMSVYAGVAESAVVVGRGLASDRQKDPTVPYLLGELANHLTMVQLAVEAAGGAGFYRKARLERLLRDVHAAQFHPLPTKRQQRFTGRMALSLDPVADGT